jgi:uncharacterized membrane protein
LGLSWIGHYNQYVAIRRADRFFLWINVAFLSAIVVVPFSSALLGQYPFERVAVQIYAFNLAVAGALLYGHWAYATSQKRLVDPDISADLVRRTARRVLIAPIGYSLIVVMAFISIPAALVACFAIPIYFILPGKVDRHWHRLGR